MRKSRELPFDWGVTDNPSHKYAAVSSSCKDWQAWNRGWWLHEVCLGLYDTYRSQAAKTYSMPGYLRSGSSEIEYSTRPMPLYNNCDHYRTIGMNHPFQAAILIGTTVSMQYYWRNSPYGVLVIPPDLKRHHDVDLTAARSAAWATMQPRFEGDISMFNFIVELKDVKQLSKLLLKKPLLKLRNYFMKLKRKRGLVDPTKTMAENYLQVEFGIKPLLADIFTIVGQLEEIVKQAQNEFAEAGTGENVRHYTEHFPISEVPSWSAYYVGKYPYRHEGTSFDVSFTATMQYAYEYSARGSIDAFMRYWGLIPTQEAVWNALPFSFLVDYFLTVGNSLNRMRRDQNVNMQLAQYCESVTSRSSSGSFYRRGSMYNGWVIVDGIIRDPTNSPNNVLVCGNETKLYTRKVTTPYKGVVLPSVRLSSRKQILNMAALLRTFM